MNKKFTIYALLLLIIGTTGCSPHSMMNHPPVTSEEVFIAEMIPHHQEAVDTSLLVLESENPEVKALAEAIILAQESEIDMMNSWLSQWYSTSTYQIKYENMMPDLLSLEGEARDKAYLKGMIEHHQGAIEMAKQAQKLELRKEVLALTEAIITSQKDEIELMEKLLK
jgi:uncharacterized protein (DUF305 family)